MKYPEPSFASPHPSNAGNTASPASPNGSSGNGSLAGPCAAIDIGDEHTAARVQATITTRGSLIASPLYEQQYRNALRPASLLLLLCQRRATRLDLGEIVCFVEIRDVQ